MKKRIIFIIVFILILLILIIGIFLLPNKSNNKENNPIPYVEEKELKISSAKEEFKVPYKPYAKDVDGNPIDIDGVSFDDATGTYSFYDYKKSEEDENGYVEYSFKYDFVLPITYYEDISIEKPVWKRSLAFLQPNVFDYYTGELYREKNVTISGNINYHSILNAPEEDMDYSDITWNDKIYKIGVRMEHISKFDGVKTEMENGLKKYTDTLRVTTIAYIYAPNNYDGIMIDLVKRNSSKDLVLNQIENNNKYQELLKEAEATGNKSEELIKMEDELNRLHKLLEPQNGILNPTKDDFYIFRMTDIKR